MRGWLERVVVTAKGRRGGVGQRRREIGIGTDNICDSICNGIVAFYSPSSQTSWGVNGITNIVGFNDEGKKLREFSDNPNTQ